MEEMTVNENFSKKKKICTFSWKCVTIILAICLAGSIASLLTVIMLPPSGFLCPPDTSFRLIKDYYVSDISTLASWDDYRKLNQELLGKINPRDDFWNDKIKTQECVDGVEEGVQMVPILWSERTRNKIFAQDELKKFLTTKVNWKNYPLGLILKPAHLATANNIITISEIDFTDNWEDIKEQINKIPMTKQEVADWQKDPKHQEMAYATLNPGLLLQKKFDISGNPFREIKISIVWGKVVAFSWSVRGIVIMGVNENDKSRFCLASDFTDGCEVLEKMMNWDLVLPKIEKFASKLHLDFVRVDIFPIDQTVKFYVNEVEADCARSPLYLGKFVLEKLKSCNQILENSKNPETFFLDRKLHDLRCNIFDTPYFWKSTQ